MAGCLYVVATPIGNLEDVTLRALRVLREVELIAAEDTRRTAHLLQHYSISTRTTSLHEHNERRKLPGLVGRLQKGARIALVSDAGTPGISDPGARLVAAAHDAGVRVEAVPGPSAVLAALSCSGFPASPFRFLGFPPVRSKDRKKWISSLAETPDTVVFFEAPHRILQTLGELEPLLVKRPILVGREFSKLHEELVIGPISKVRAALRSPRGEYTVVVGPRQPGDEPPHASPDDAAIGAEFGQLTENGDVGRRDAVRQLAERYGLRVKHVYQALERSKKSIE